SGASQAHRRTARGAVGVNRGSRPSNRSRPHAEKIFPARHSPGRARQGEGGVEVHLMANRGNGSVSGKKTGPVAAHSGLPWPADAVERRHVALLVPYARNARTHSPVQVAQIAASIREWGWTVPVLVDEQSNIIAGHCRVLAAQRLGLDEVPVMVAHGWSEAQKQAYVIADNKLALNAGWDEDLLRIELGELKGLGADLGLTGFGELELDALFGSGADGRTDPDEAPELPVEPVTHRGDLWVCGQHRILCGDATAAGDVEKVMAGD